MKYKDLLDLPRLTAREECIASAEDLVIFNVKLAYSRARRWEGQGIDFDDLEQEAIVGLVRAASKFDPHRGVRFSTHATPWIDNEIRRCVQKAKTVRLPIYLQQEANGDALPPSFKEAGTSEDEGVLDLEDHDSPSPYEALSLNRWRGMVLDRMPLLTAREAQILDMFYGLSGGAPMTVTAIATEQGLSPGRITQIRQGAEEKLRKG